MTVGVGIVVPGAGCVLACDSRVMAGYTIVTDTCEKFVLCGKAIAIVSGQDGGLLDVVKAAKNLVQLHKYALEYTENKSLSWDMLIWDRASSYLHILDHTGSFLHPGSVATIGAGGDIAQGFLDAHTDPPNGLMEAGLLAEASVYGACRRNAACGGLARLITIPLHGRPVVT